MEIKNSLYPNYIFQYDYYFSFQPVLLIANINKFLGADENNKGQIGVVDITGKGQKNFKALNIFYVNVIMQI